MSHRSGSRSSRALNIFLAGVIPVALLITSVSTGNAADDVAPVPASSEPDVAASPETTIVEGTPSEAPPEEGAPADPAPPTDTAPPTESVPPTDGVPPTDSVPPTDGEQGQTPPGEAGLAPTPDAGADGQTAPAPGGSGGQSVAGAGVGGAPASFMSFDIKGGYTAAGVGLRNRGFGTINLTGIPVGATVTKAYLYWTVLNNTEATNLKQGKINGSSITGTRVGLGASPCWTQATQGFSYRADVTTRVTKNGSYALSGFASGQTNGADPFTTTPIAPLAEGASLVVVYTKSTYPQTVIKINNGYHLTTSSTTGATLSVPFGFAASNPVGEVRTTFIGADGQSNLSEPASTFNNVAQSSVDWDGTDAPTTRYSQGNLWDTDTVRAVNLVRPGNTSASIKVSGGPDCLVWVAQVLSIGKNGAADTDGDKLLDGWEANGHDANADGTIDVPLPQYGASVVHKDLFVEMDYMGAETTCPCHLPLASDLARIVAVFATSPSANNPDGLTGRTLHLDAGAARGTTYNLGGGNLVPFDSDLNPVNTQFNAIKSTNFNARRAKIFYYMIWAHNYGGGSSSGNAFAIPNDSFVVTLGSWSSGGTSDVKVGTFIHEFGHTLGLHHGGNVDTNYKPNYLSVMTYGFQTTGVPKTSGPASFSYSSSDLPDLNENSLKESVGLNSTAAASYKTRWFCPNGVQNATAGSANGPINWNCTSTSTQTVAVDLNRDGVRNTLTGWNDWTHITYGGGAVGAGSEAGREASVPAPEQELTVEEANQIAAKP